MRLDHATYVRTSTYAGDQDGTTVELVDADHVRRFVDPETVAFFVNLGGTESTTVDRGIITNVSTSPDGETVRTTTFVPVTSRTVWATWHGGHGYAVPSLESREVFPSTAAAVETFRNRLANVDGSTPCVDSSATMHLYHADPAGDDVTDPYPSRVVEIGPRGAVRVTNV